MYIGNLTNNMKEDYYKTLYKRTVTQVPDGRGSYSETTSDTPFQGFIAVLSGYEFIRSQQMGLSATARLLTSASLSVTDRVVDTSGYFGSAGAVYEVVFAYNQFHKYYDLKLI